MIGTERHEADPNYKPGSCALSDSSGTLKSDRMNLFLKISAPTPTTIARTYRMIGTERHEAVPICPTKSKVHLGPFVTHGDYRPESAFFGYFLGAARK